MQAFFTDPVSVNFDTGAAVPLSMVGATGPNLTQCGRGRGLPPCQVASWSIQPFGHNTPNVTDRTHRQRSNKMCTIFGWSFIKWFTLCYQTFVYPVCPSVPPIFSPFYCGHTAGWIKMALAMKVGLGPGHIVLDGTRGYQSTRHRVISSHGHVVTRSTRHRSTRHTHVRSHSQLVTNQHITKPPVPVVNNICTPSGDIQKQCSTWTA